MNDEAESAAAGTPHFCELDPERANRRKAYAHSPKRRDVSRHRHEHHVDPVRERGRGPRVSSLWWRSVLAALWGDTRLEAMCEELGLVISWTTAKHPSTRTPHL